MKKYINHFVFTLLLNVSLVLQADTVLPVDAISAEFSVAPQLLKDFVDSYNFKCPAVLSEAQLRALLSDKYADNELNVMIESNELNWRDIYVEARSNIACLTEGVVSKGY